MVEIETPPANRSGLFVPERPHLQLPEGETERPELVTDLKGTDSLSDFLPKTHGTVYAIFAVREIPTFSPLLPEIVESETEKAAVPTSPDDTAPPDQETKKPTVNLLVVTFVKDEDPVEGARKMDRGMQRAGQYDKIIQQTTAWEEQLRRGENPRYFFTYKQGELTKPVAVPVTHQMIDQWKHMAASFYAGQLSTEPFTDELAKGLLAQQTLREDAVVAQAERIIFDHQRANLEDIEVTHTEIAIDSKQLDTQETNRKPKQEVTGSTSTPIESSAQEPEQEAEMTETAVVEAALEIIRLDRPSQQAEMFFEKVWSKNY